jgi:hypothetical protein
MTKFLAPTFRLQWTPCHARANRVLWQAVFGSAAKSGGMHKPLIATDGPTLKRLESRTMWSLLLSDFSGAVGFVLDSADDLDLDVGAGEHGWRR